VAVVTKTEITDEMVEKAAKALWRMDYSLSWSGSARYIQYARAALESLNEPERVSDEWIEKMVSIRTNLLEHDRIVLALQELQERRKADK